MDTTKNAGRNTPAGETITSTNPDKRSQPMSKRKHTNTKPYSQERKQAIDKAQKHMDQMLADGYGAEIELSQAIAFIYLEHLTDEQRDRVYKTSMKNLMREMSPEKTGELQGKLERFVSEKIVFITADGVREKLLLLHGSDKETGEQVYLEFNMDIAREVFGMFYYPGFREGCKKIVFAPLLDYLLFKGEIVGHTVDLEVKGVRLHHNEEKNLTGISIDDGVVRH